MNYRTALVATAAIGAMVLAGCGSSGGGASTGAAGDRPFEGTQLVVTSFGGDWEKAFEEAVIGPFEADTGAQVKLVTAYSADALAQLTAQARNPQLDVVNFSGGQEVPAAANKLIQPINPADLPSYGQLQPAVQELVTQGYGPAFQVTPIGLVYNTDKVSPPPTSWLDLQKPEYAKHIALPDFSNSYGVLSMLALNSALGSTIDNVTPGIDALGRLASTGDAIVVPTSADLQAAFAQRDIWLAPYAQDYAETLRQAGLPVKFAVPSEGVTASFVTANVVAGRPNTALATTFVDYTLRPSAQAIFAERMRYSPVNKETTVPPEVRDAVLAPEQFGQIVRYDGQIIADRRQAWADDWNTRITR